MKLKNNIISEIVYFSGDFKINREIYIKIGNRGGDREWPWPPNMIKLLF